MEAKRLLLIEDDFLIALAETKMLKKKGYEVTHVRSGEQAVEYALNMHPDLILMDINLGSGIDGTEAASRIVKQADIPIIFLSSHNEEEVVRKTEGITTYGYVVKDSGDFVLNASIKMAFRLHEAKTQTKEVFENSINGICVHEMLYNESGQPYDCKYLQVNQAFNTQTGIEKNLEGMTIKEMYPNGEADYLIEKYGSMLYSRVPIREEIYFEPTKRYFEISAFPLGKLNKFAVAVNDITENHTAKKELTKSDTRYKKAEIAAGLGIWEMNLDTGEVFWSDEFFRICGYEPGSVTPSAEVGFSIVHEDDRERAALTVQQAIDNGASYHIEKRIRKPDGEVVWVESIGNIEIDEADNSKKLVGSFQDITQRRKREEKLETVLREVHHRVKNNFAAIESMLFLEAGKSSSDEAKVNLLDARGRVSSMKIVYDKLLETSDYESINVKDYFENFIEAIVAVFQNGSGITIEKNLDSFRLTPKYMFPLGVIVNEFITNSMKYAFKGREKGTVLLRIENNDGLVRVTLKDDGKGLPDAAINSEPETLGLLLIRGMCEQINSKHTLLNNNGLELNLEFSPGSTLV